MLHAVTTGAYYPPVGTPLEDFDYQSILVDSGIIVQWSRNTAHLHYSHHMRSPLMMRDFASDPS